MKIVFVLIISAMLSSCTEDRGTTLYYAFVENNSAHVIKLTGYSNGQVNPGESLEIGPGENFTMSYGRHRGMDLDTYQGFRPKYFGRADSVVVTFDNAYKVVHYVLAAPQIVPIKSIEYHSTRNITQLKSYERKHHVDGFQVIDTFQYHFVETDYLFAHG